jgi:hypothetical protein
MKASRRTVDSAERRVMESRVPNTIRSYVSRVSFSQARASVLIARTRGEA